MRREPESLPQLEALLATTQRLEQSVQGLHAALQTLTTQVHSQQVAVKNLATPPPLIEPPRPPRPSVLAPVAAMIAAIAALGALAGAALLIHEQKRIMMNQSESTSSLQGLRQSVAQLTETVANLPAPGSHAAGKSAADGASKPAETAGADGPPAACPPAADSAAASKAKVLLPNLVGLRLAEARTAVAPLQLQLLPTDKKLKEISKIGWQLPNPGAELEPDEAVTVSLKPPPPKKKKKP